MGRKRVKKISTSEFNVISLRFATACGASPKLRLDLVLNDLVASAIINQHVEVLSDGTPWRPLVHVEDMVVLLNGVLIIIVKKIFYQ